MARFWQPPILRNTKDNHEQHRHVTWLELFFDLAFVVAIASVAHELSNVNMREGIMTFAMLFIPVWWAWLGDAIYNNRYDPEDHANEIITMIQMFGVVGLAIFAHNGLHGGFVGFVLSFSLVRFMLAFLNYRVGKYHKNERKITNYFIGTVLISQIFWLSSIFADDMLRYTLAGIGIAIELLAPIFNARYQQQAYLNADHLSSRFGFFIIIILGEILAAVVRSAHEMGHSSRGLLLAALAVIMAFSFWWIYFENENGPRVIKKFFSRSGKLEKKNVISGYTWVYSHLPLSMGLIAFALAVERIIATGPDITLSPRLLFVLLIGLIVALLSTAIMQMAALTHAWCQKLHHIKMVLPFISIILLLVAVLVGKFIQPLTVLGIFTGTLLIQVLLQEIIEHVIEKHSGGHSQQHGHSH